jgi:site-specific DNA-cytosine methylase
MCILRWYIELVVSSQAESWSMEQVGSPKVIAQLENARKMYPKCIAYAVFDFYDLGVPQTRKRLIASTPDMLARLMRCSGAHRRRSIAQCVTNVRGTHIRNSRYHLTYRRRLPFETESKRKALNVYTKASATDSCLPVSGPGPTIMAGRYSGWWVKIVEGEVWRLGLSMQDLAELQTFPSDYAFPQPKAVATRLIGNAVPPLVAQLLLKQPNTQRTANHTHVLADPQSPSFLRL